MNPNLLEQFLGPTADFFRFNTNDINILVTPMERKTSMLTKRNLITSTGSSAVALAALNATTTASLNNTSEQRVVDGDQVNNRLSSSSSPKLSLKDKYKHVKSTIPPARPPTTASNNLSSSSTTRLSTSNNRHHHVRSHSNCTIRDVVLNSIDHNNKMSINERTKSGGDGVNE